MYTWLSFRGRIFICFDSYLGLVSAPFKRASRYMDSGKLPSSLLYSLSLLLSGVKVSCCSRMNFLYLLIKFLSPFVKRIFRITSTTIYFLMKVTMSSSFEIWLFAALKSFLSCQQVNFDFLEMFLLLTKFDWLVSSCSCLKIRFTSFLSIDIFEIVRRIAVMPLPINRSISPRPPISPKKSNTE